MVLKALVTALVALAAYSGFIYLFQDDISRTGQTAAQRNVVKAEEYQYEFADQYDTLVVGSSMSERLVMDSLGAGCYNLAMAGLSAQKGLQLIRESNRWPRLIYVETNTLLIPTQPGRLLTDTSTPVERFLRQHLPVLRQKYQPVGVFKALLRDWKYGKSQFVLLESGWHVDSAFLEKAVASNLRNQQNPLPDSVLQQHVQTIDQLLRAFRQHGTQIVLFEMPVDPRLQRTAYTRSLSAAVYQHFVRQGYPFIKPTATDTYLTTDGIHMTHQSCLAYTHYLCDALRVQRHDPETTMPRR